MRGVKARKRTRAFVIRRHEVATLGIHMKLCVDQGCTDGSIRLGGLSFALPCPYRLKKGQDARSDYTTSVWEY